MKNLFITITLFFFTLNFYGQSIESPNAEFKLNFYLDKKGRPFYYLTYNEEKIIENSGLGFIINNEIDITTNNNNDVDIDLIGDEVNLLNGFSLISLSRSSKNETWKPVWGEESLIRNN